MNILHRYAFLFIGVIGTGTGIMSWFAENGESMGEIITAIATLVNILAIIYFSLTKNRGEVKKLEAEGESEIVDAAQVNLEGAKLVTTMLKEQIDDLRKELEKEKARREDNTKYFESKIKEIETELRSYRSYASRLAAQVIEAGKIPEPLILDFDDDNDTLMENLNKQQKKIEQLKGKRKEELKNAKDNSKTIEGR